MIGVIKVNDLRLPTTIDINQLVSWDINKELVLKPVYQRNKVWNEAAKSYLIDSIMRNYPIPPIFMRDKLNLRERKTLREVVDGQQRITAILDFYYNKLQIKKSQNKDLGGMYFKELSDDQQEAFLTYKITLEKITEKDDSLVFDMFARLNSNSMPLNKQELRNAKFTGEFKVAAYEMALSFRDLFSKYGIFTSSQLSRMQDVEFISILMMEFESGVVDITGTMIDKYYLKNNEHYEFQNKTSTYLYKVLDILNKILPFIESRKSKLLSPVYLYDIVNVLKDMIEDNLEINEQKFINNFNKLDSEYENIATYEETDPMFINLANYKDNHQRHSTNKANKLSRIQFLKDWINN